MPEAERQHRLGSDRRRRERLAQIGDYLVRHREVGGRHRHVETSVALTGHHDCAGFVVANDERSHFQILGPQDALALDRIGLQLSVARVEVDSADHLHAAGAYHRLKYRRRQSVLIVGLEMPGHGAGRIRICFSHFASPSVFIRACPTRNSRDASVRRCAKFSAPYKVVLRVGQSFRDGSDILANPLTAVVFAKTASACIEKAASQKRAC